MIRPLSVVASLFILKDMTIQFVPGDPNDSVGSVSQGNWRNHHIIAYASGNNVIILTLTDNKKKSLQTVYLERDPYAVVVNELNGLIAVSVGSKVSILKPLNEYMSKPKWTTAIDINNDDDNSRVNCLDWATEESELIVGSEESLCLYHVSGDYDAYQLQRRWFCKQPSAVERLAITPDASKIVSYNSLNFDSFAKLWMRGNYSDANSLFELKYLQHDTSLWLTDFFWRSSPSMDKSEVDLQLISSMKRSPHPLSFETSHDVLYTVTNDKQFNVWATYDSSGHCNIKLWALMNLTHHLSSRFLASTVVDGEFLKSELPEALSTLSNETSKVSRYFENVSDLTAQDILLVWGSVGEVAVYVIANITMTPPSSIKFIHLDTFPINKICFPSPTKHKKASHMSLDELRLFSNPISISALTRDHSSLVQFLVHDRVKRTIRSDVLSFEHLLKESPQGFQLKSKFQGHTKSIQKLVTSTSSPTGNVLLSISDFSKHNYIWEPLLLQSEGRNMSITRRFRLNVSKKNEDDEHNQGIVDALLINDITDPIGHLRHHLAFVIERGGYVSVWDCNGVTMDDREAELMKRSDLLDAHDNRILSPPQALFFHKVSDDNYGVICVFNADLIKAWIISVKKNKVVCRTNEVDTFPGTYSDGTCMVSAVDTYLEKDLSVIDSSGVFRSLSVYYDEQNEKFSWKEKLKIHTSILKADKIHGASLIKKLALIDEEGRRLTIWDMQSGLLEYEETFPEAFGEVHDLDWAFIDSGESSTTALLSVGFSRFVLLYTQLRYDYTNRVPTFAVLKKIDVSDYTSHEIADSIWMDGGYLVIGCGNQFFIDDKWVNVGESSTNAAEASLTSTVKQLMAGYDPERSQYLISDLAKILNGPLPVYHPQFLIQALLNNEVKLVKDILVELLGVLRSGKTITWNLNLSFLEALIPTRKPIQRRLSQIDVDTSGKIEVFKEFDENVLELLIEKLLKVSLPLLTRHQQITLTNVVSLVNELSKLEHSRDENGLKFILGFKLFQSSSKQTRLTMRDINWALHSDQKEMLFVDVDNYFKHRMTWENVRLCGLVYWTDTARLKNVVESVARTDFGDSRDPSGRVSVLFLAIKKKQVLIGLWRTVSHPEKEKVIKFLNNDFGIQRWKTAASKNAFVLLSKHRYMDAAYFFLLAGLVKDCCITLCNKLEDVELALAVARISEDDEAQMHIIERFILPKAISEGDRWMTSWVFWKMKLKEVAIQALVKSPERVVKDNRERFSEGFQKEVSTMEPDVRSRSFLQDDPVLAILFHKLRLSKLNYFEGSKAITPQEEFDFVIKVCSIYSRMGCDYLALLMLRNWAFLNVSSNHAASSTKDEGKSKELFKEFSAAPTKAQPDAPPSIFVEPDMSAFDFGF